MKVCTILGLIAPFVLASNTDLRAVHYSNVDAGIDLTYNASKFKFMCFTTIGLNVGSYDYECSSCSVRNEDDQSVSIVVDFSTIRPFSVSTFVIMQAEQNLR